MVYHSQFTPITSSLSRSYVIPALFLNPILFLHSVNAILSRILDPIFIHNVAVQPAPYTVKGPSAQHPHLDIHASDQLCWSYTLVMVGVQLIAFSGIQTRRERWKEAIKCKKEAERLKKSQDLGLRMNGVLIEVPLAISDIMSAKSHGPDTVFPCYQNGSPEKEEGRSNDPFDGNGDDNESEESEVIL